ncbi:DUF928 domain-containing protein [Coleofasciculus sp. FACHB-1120]|uniref:DUF928 domain-containing protein n=1 Tax=Coleofasciculus sp. FACHB-1120 TaxID=2692783 RepID=UPI0016850416|nr:DUF928 domain-containing protein [Coleofasciculus sp. FACHB-1120]MBD2743790.1 DUF928 domain-containing protein [Coleofasciculus sp. FACHB-1120]
MSLQPLFAFMAISFLLLAESASTLAQSAPKETAPILGHDAKEAQNPITQVLFKPSDNGPPPDTRGAGSRNDRHCPQDAPTNPDSPAAEPLALTALVPSNQEGLTWAERPTLWVYLPETSARQMVLSVREEGSRSHSQRFVPITGKPRIVGIPLDEKAPPLEVGKSYQWAVVLVCGDRPSPNDPFVTASVRRVVPSSKMNAPQKALERAAWYGEQGIWHEALTALAEARRGQPVDPALARIWSDFLTQPSVGLGAIANEPLR